jgi:hypothetical protein
MYSWNYSFVSIVAVVCVRLRRPQVVMIDIIKYAPKWFVFRVTFLVPL